MDGAEVSRPEGGATRVKKQRGHEMVGAKRVKTADDGVRFIDDVGFCMLFPVKGVLLPSLYFAVSRRRDARWDKHARLIWQWKDELPRKRQAFYAKYFKGRGTFISIKLLPQFLAMHEAAVAPEDAGALYAAGRISQDARAIWQALAEHGALATLELRHACKMDSQAGNKRFKKSMLELQRLLIVTHFGTEQETEAWASNCFDLVSRAFPKQLEQAGRISPAVARAILARQYHKLYPGASPTQLARLFGWSKAEAVAALGV